ncbi:MAG: transcriptional regulator, partial [Erysipelotrichaceae bacterium]|nr:transcriptional regulator [Erysipelotrichaceae bacterium]
MFDTTTIQEFNDLEFRIYDYIMKNSEKVVYMRIRDLAMDVHVSTTAILRVC